MEWPCQAALYIIYYIYTASILPPRQQLQQKNMASAMLSSDTELFSSDNTTAKDLERKDPDSTIEAKDDAEPEGEPVSEPEPVDIASLPKFSLRGMMKSRIVWTPNFTPFLASKFPS